MNIPRDIDREKMFPAETARSVSAPLEIRSTGTVLADWNRATGEALETLQTPAFPRALQMALKTVIAYDISMVFAYSGREKPICLDHNMEAARAATVIEDYIRGPYLLDPFYAAAVGTDRAGVIRLKTLAPDLFYNSEYFKRHYVRTGIRDEVGFLVRPSPGAALVFSVTRPIDRPAFSARDMQLFQAVEPVVRRLAEFHWRDVAARFGPSPGPAGGGLKDGPIGVALDQMADGRLTRREIEITALVLRGHSNASIADLLKISAGTVKIHRRNIYQKLDISNQADLFSRFIGHLAQIG